MDKKLLIPFGYLLLMAVVIVIVLTEDKCTNNYYCSDLETFKKEEFAGGFEHKFYDSLNHNVRTIIFHDGKDLFLSRDTSSFFDYLESGDFIKKKKGTDTVTVQRKDRISYFKIYFGCSP